MFWEQSRSNLRMELAELRHKHKLELEAKEVAFNRSKEQWEADKTLVLKKLTQEHELKLKELATLNKLDTQQQIRQAQLDADKKVNDAVRKLNDESYEALKGAMTKLHEEGNVTTRFTQDIALKLMGESNKHETKVLTGTVNVTGE